jgi:hypothetical protein
MAIEFETVAENKRLEFYPKLFGPLNMMRGEALTMDFVSAHCQEYESSYWEFYEASNGARFMAPRMDKVSLQLYVPGNFYTVELSPIALGIVATSFALSTLSFERVEFDDCDSLVQNYQLLRELALEQPEREELLRALD